jgi:hypothetical protein
VNISFNYSPELRSRIAELRKLHGSWDAVREALTGRRIHPAERRK